MYPTTRFPHPPPPPPPPKKKKKIIPNKRVTAAVQCEFDFDTKLSRVESRVHLFRQEINLACALNMS